MGFKAASNEPWARANNSSHRFIPSVLSFYFYSYSFLKVESLIYLMLICAIIEWPLTTSGRKEKLKNKNKNCAFFMRKIFVWRRIQILYRNCYTFTVSRPLIVCHVDKKTAQALSFESMRSSYQHGAHKWSTHGHVTIAIEDPYLEEKWS